ncbi:MAG: amidophosphoribosyltransferase [bacterium]
MSGLFGVVSTGNCNETLLYGTDYHSHMGTEMAGMVVVGSRIHRRIHDIRLAQFKSKFADEYRSMTGQLGIGVISDLDPQPILMSTHFGDFAVATMGRLLNAPALIQQLHKQGAAFSEIIDGGINRTEIVARMIASGKNPVDGLATALGRVEGSCSILLLTAAGLYAARDNRGRTPLVLGRRGGDWAVASESCSFTNLGFRIERDIGPGEILYIEPHGLQQMRPGFDKKRVCAFLWIYTGYPASCYEGVSVEAVRERCGRALARGDQVEADFAAGVPDSGTGHAIGYAMQAGIPYRRPLVKYTPGYGRSYTPPSQEIRDLVAEMKLLPVRDVIEGNRIVLCEDSIVRGTQLRNLTVQKLWEGRAREIHIRPACPPLMFPCKFLRATRSVHELAARRAITAIEGKELESVDAYLDEESRKYADMVDWIRRDLNVTTLRYQRLTDMVEAIGLPREHLCLYCWTGEE